jgi:hypothetical protein
MQQEHERQIENSRLRPERRLQFIGYWRKVLYKDTTTYKGILKEKSYARLEKFISPEACNLIQQAVKESEKELEELQASLKWKEKVYHRKWWDEDDDEYRLKQELFWESIDGMEYLGNYFGVEKALDDLAETKSQVSQAEKELTTFMKTHLIEELRRLEEEWELL